MAECLEHLKPLDPELIVIDTGSNDSTRDISRSAGAKVFESSWEEDFSKPRNLSLQFATRPWILCLDPDERIAPSQFDLLKSMIRENVSVKAYALYTRNYVRERTFGTVYPCDGKYSEEAGYPFFFLSSKIRLFRNHLGIQFKGVVHETVTESVVRVCRPGDFQDSELLIHHYGCDSKVREQKNKKDLYRRLTERKIMLEPENPEAFIEFGRECLASFESERAIRAFRRAVDLDPDSPYYLLELVRAHWRINQRQETRVLIEKGLQLEPQNSEFQRYRDQLGRGER